ncbi:MAG: hypothetical protein HY825_15860 [Acidobacteria bacterium]|nr:hypothetical protein [Acidobacteriota bacterium]
MRERVVAVVVAFLVGGVGAAWAQWGQDPLLDRAAGKKAQGGVVVRDGAVAWEDDDSDDVVWTFKRGDCVVALSRSLISQYEFREKNGRVAVQWLDKGMKGKIKTGWMELADLAKFNYDCGCESPECFPFSGAGGISTMAWNPCVQEAYDWRLERLDAQQVREEPKPAKRSGGSSQASKEKPLTNKDVVELVKLDLGDDVVIAKIRQAPREELDVSTAALGELKGAGVSKAVIQAMIARAGERK